MTSMITTISHHHHSNHRNSKKRAVACMTAAIAFHFAGYELARAATISLFTSEDVNLSTYGVSSFSSSGTDNKTRTVLFLGGFGSRTAVMLPLAVCCVSPCSLFLLWTYSYHLERIGPKRTLVRTTVISSLVLFIAVMALRTLQSLAQMYLIHADDSQQGKSYTFPSSVFFILFLLLVIPSTSHSSLSVITHLSYCYKGILFLLLVVQNSNVQLLFTQHWSYLGSVLCTSEANIWFAPIAGVGSIASTLAVRMIGIFDYIT